jgi:hypothetical protein
MPDVLEQLRAYGEAVEAATDTVAWSPPTRRHALLLAAAVVIVLAGVVGAVWALRAGEEAEPPVVSTVDDAGRPGWRMLDPGPLRPREQSAVVWTGDELVVWGGTPGNGVQPPLLRDGAAFDPGTGTWRPMSPPPETVGGPSVGVWTGDEVVVLSGPSDPRAWGPVDGAAWDPTTDTWRGMAALGAASLPHDLVWTGDEVLSIQLGAAYDPSTDTWRELPDRPRGGAVVATVWTGEEAIVLVPAGPTNVVPGLSTVGLAYDPADDDWRILPPTGLSEWVRLAWNGEVVLGVDGQDRVELYDPAADRWEQVDRLPIPPQEACDGHPVSIDGHFVISACMATARLTDDRQWQIGVPAPHETVDVVAAGDQVLSWTSTGDTLNFGDDHQFLQAYGVPDSDGLELGRTIPFEFFAFTLPPGAHLTGIETTEVPEGARFAEPASVFTITTDADECTLSLDEYVTADAEGQATEEVAAAAATSGVRVERVRLTTTGDRTYRATVARLPSGTVLWTGPDSFTTYDVSCGELRTAEAIFAGIRPG